MPNKLIHYSRLFRKFIITSIASMAQPLQTTSIIVRSTQNDPNPVVVPVVIRRSSK
jgi:hypothetical protein